MINFLNFNFLRENSVNKIIQCQDIMYKIDNNKERKMNKLQLKKKGFIGPIC